MKTNTSHVARTIVAITVIATGAGLHAQNSTTTKQDESNITVTGCLQPAGSDRTAVGTSGTRGSDTRAGANAGDSKAFMLVNARVGAAPGGGSGVTSVAPAGSGTTESAVRAGSVPPSPAITGATDTNGNATPAGGMYALTGDNPELPRHAGQEVEISGRLIAANTAPSSATSAGNTPQATTDRAPQLEVRTIRMIASVCAAR